MSNYNNGPLVTVLIPTYNRPHYLPIAIDSVVNQQYKNLEIFVMNDGGVDVSDIIDACGDKRINFINGKENRGLPVRINQALSQAQGKYVCYLGDDDLFYPNHVNTLVETLEYKTDCQLAYSDLYKVYCRIGADGSRTVLSKIVEISRDFDRFFMFNFNHTLHVSLMHRRDLLDKAGPSNESLNVLIDWDLTRRLVFYTDFFHVHDITGEFYAPLGKSDRISVKRRQNLEEYTRNVMTIRTTRPPKPWDKVDDLSIIFLTDRFDQKAGNALGSIWKNTCYPNEVYLPMPPEQFAAINTQMPNLVNVPAPMGLSYQQQVDTSLEKCQGEYIAIVPRGYPIQEMWVEDSLYPMVQGLTDEIGYELEESNEQLWVVVIRKEALVNARRQYPSLSVKESLARSGYHLGKIKPEQIPFQFDELYNQGQKFEKDGDWISAGLIYEHLLDNKYGNEIWMNSLAAESFLNAGQYDKALAYSSKVNEVRPTVDTLLVEAKAKKKQKDYSSAIGALEKAVGVLGTRQLQWK